MGEDRLREEQAIVAIVFWEDSQFGQTCPHAATGEAEFPPTFGDKPSHRMPATDLSHQQGCSGPQDDQSKSWATTCLNNQPLVPI